MFNIEFWKQYKIIIRSNSVALILKMVTRCRK